MLRWNEKVNKKNNWLEKLNKTKILETLTSIVISGRVGIGQAGLQGPTTWPT